MPPIFLPQLSRLSWLPRCCVPSEREYLESTELQRLFPPSTFIGAHTSSLASHTNVYTNSLSPLLEIMAPSSIDFLQICLAFHRSHSLEPIRKVQVTTLLALICFLGPEKCMPGILALARELLIVPVCVHKL